MQWGSWYLPRFISWYGHTDSKKHWASVNHYDSNTSFGEIFSYLKSNLSRLSQEKGCTLVDHPCDKSCSWFTLKPDRTAIKDVYLALLSHWWMKRGRSDKEPTPGTVGPSSPQDTAGVWASHFAQFNPRCTFCVQLSWAKQVLLLLFLRLSPSSSPQLTTPDKTRQLD